MSWRRTKSAPQVRGGRVQHKNNWRPTPDNYGHEQVSIARLRPGRGYRHVLRCSDVFTFVHLLPDWGRLRTRLNQVLLAPNQANTLGWHRPGTVAVCAMARQLVEVFDREFFLLDRDFFDRLGVRFEVRDDEAGTWGPVPEHGQFSLAVVYFTPATARCYQLTRVLTHELGHHYDRITNRKRWASRGEPFAYRYERETERVVWSRYLEVFGDPRASER